MSNDLETGIERLEMALKLLRHDGLADWFEAYQLAEEEAAENDEQDWAAIRDLIVIATHGAPLSLSYLDKEWQAIISGHCHAIQK
jgi:hypothetical protein